MDVYMNMYVEGRDSANCIDSVLRTKKKNIRVHPFRYLGCVL